MSNNIATPNQIDAIERIIKTHQVDRATLVNATGPIENLTKDQANALLMALADGECGGITMGEVLNPDRIHPVQFAVLYSLATQIYEHRFVGPVCAIIQGIYPEITTIDGLNKRQAARIIVELDRLIEKKGSNES